MKKLLASTVCAVLLSACITLGDTAGDAGAAADAGGACGSETCSSSQLCLYRECSEKDRCKPSATCPAGTTPTDCGGQPGCLLTTCGPLVQGCRSVPDACGGDVTCACNSICGSASACSKVNGRNVLCAAP